MLEKISKSIDTLSIKQGEISALLGLPLLVVVMYEVVMRYVFDAPTSWGFETYITIDSPAPGWTGNPRRN